MTFQPKPGAALDIEGKIYHIAEHPQAPDMPYGQEGRRAVVYQLLGEDGENYALKDFKQRFRIPGMVGVAEQLEPYINLAGLQACQRTVLTASHHRELLTEYPDLTYAVLMPWVEGPTWQELLLSEESYSSQLSLTTARSFAELMVSLEEKRLAHCDLSGPNLIIQTGNQPGLVDLEEMYGPGFLEPESLPAGSPGYAHRSAPNGQWNATTDRFSGAILIAEMLCWFDPAVQEAAWGESYFAPKDMQSENQRQVVLRKSLETHFGKRILDLFDQVWRSDSLRDCPTFAEWAVALPMEVEQQDPIKITEAAEDERLPAKNDTAVFILNEQKAAVQGKNDQAISWYRKAIALAPPELSGEIEKRIKDLDNLEAEQMEVSQTGEKDEEKPARPCPVCGEQIPVGQEVCPYCEGKPKARQDQPFAPGGKRHKTTLLGSGIGLIVISGIVLIVLGRGGSGPLSSLETGKQTPIGTAAIKPLPTKTQVPTATSVPIARILYEIDFEKNGADLWNLDDDWEVIKDETGNHYLLGMGPNDYPQAWYKEDDTPWKNYAFESRVKFIRGHLFMCLRSYPGKSSFFTATFDSDNNWVNIAEFDQETIGWRNIGDGVKKGISKNTWYLFRVEIVDDQITIFIDDKFVLKETASDPIASERGGIGFYMGGGQEIHFDDIRVWELP